MTLAGASGAPALALGKSLLTSKSTLIWPGSSVSCGLSISSAADDEPAAGATLSRSRRILATAAISRRVLLPTPRSR